MQSELFLFYEQIEKSNFEAAHLVYAKLCLDKIPRNVLGIDEQSVLFYI